MSQLPVMFGASLIEALIAIGALAGCSPTSKQRTDVREWFAEHGVPVEEDAQGGGGRLEGIARSDGLNECLVAHAPTLAQPHAFGAHGRVAP